MIRNSHFYARNESCAYPLDDLATAVDNAGLRLPNAIITDLNLRWPSSYGRYAFVSSVTVTPQLVSLTLQVATSLDAESFSPLAVVAVMQPLTQGRQYALDSQIPGCGGWIVFGHGVEEPYRGRFSTVRQGLLAARIAKPYRELPIGGLRSYDAGTSLHGLVRLRAAPPLEIVKESREIGGVVRDCAVIRLVDDAGADGVIQVDAAGNPVTANDTSIFKQFAGPCGGRPESRSCGDPQPIEFLDVVGPDCDGILTVEFRGCAEVYQIQDVCGIAVDCGLGLSSACLPPHIPDEDGRLPDEYEPVDITIPPVDPDPTPDLSETIIASGALPYADCFKDGMAQLFVVKSGLWNLPPDLTNLWLPCPVGDYAESVSGLSDSGGVGYAYASNTAAGRSVAVWDGFDYSTLGRRFTTSVKLTAGPSGAAHNAGAVINYRPHATIDGRFVYHYVEIDYDAQQIRLSRFNGTAMQTAAPVDVTGILLEKWYEISVDVEPLSGNTVNITARIISLEDLSVDVTIGPVGFNNFYPSTGLFGFGTNRAISRFGYFELEML